ncbi:hypothetical protein IFM89_015655 [Coptis chinensis]|uniref:RNase H type-1 domain-containing protein n=1 Tax=Coptis chinensis TaxID=261450 RepID=A0A835ITP8_9MAGN|nr:hypothetical protein IFM89_015655 [Coptis chinensis]
MSNFLWSGDSQKKKVVIINLDKVCKAYEEGVSLHDVKKSTNEDYLVWWPDIKGHFSAQGTVWKLCSKATATDENIKKRGVTIASKCRHCGAQEESLIHLLWECVFAKEMWNWLAGKFQFRGTFSNMKEAIKLSKNSSPRVVHLWTTAIFGGMTGLWKHRNMVFFQDKAVSKAFCEGSVRSHIITTSYLSKGHTESSDAGILNEWGIHMNAVAARRKIHCIWIPPAIAQVKLNTDGAARGNPGPGGFGVSFRDHIGNFLYVMGGGLGNTTCYLAECTTIVEGVEVALSRGWNNLWVESDSSAVVTAANSSSMPWELLNRWKLCSRACTSLRVTHT